MFHVKRPCPTCPFRRQPRFRGLRRADDIAADLRAGQSFHCYETVDYSDDDFDGVIVEKSQMCAGAMMVLHNEDTVFVNQMVRIACRFLKGSGIADVEGFPETHYDFDGVAVYCDFDEFIETVY